MMVETMYGLMWRDQGVGRLVEPFQVKLLTRMMSISVVKLLMRLKISHIVITTISYQNYNYKKNYKKHFIIIILLRLGPSELIFIRSELLED